MGTTRFLVISGMILAAAGSRLLPHPPNFTPIAAMALFAGATLSSRWQAFLVPLAAMVLSDLVLYSMHTETHDPAGYLAMQLVVYACFAATVSIGLALQSRRKVLPLAGAALGSSILFFVVTNFAVWVLRQGNAYPSTMEGLVACYVAALPFFQWTVLGDLGFAAVIFGVFALLEQMVPALREREMITDSAPALSSGEREEQLTAVRQ